MIQDRQIGGWMRASEQREFMRYLEQFRLGPGPVAALLILRELRCRRLPALRDKYPAPAEKGRARISARPDDLAVKKAFDAHARDFDLSPDPAAALVFRAELAERSLEKWMESD